MTLVSALASASPAGRPSLLWSSDRGDGTYRNPVLHADYSDPDAIRVGEDFWMVSSSFSHVPGLPILHSRDLVHWALVGHALPRLVPAEAFALPQPGKGVWAPAIRHHAGRYWIYFPDPDRGLYLTTAADPRGPWSAPQLIKAGQGLIDPCPLWDDDGALYLVHGWAKSRAGFSNVLTVLRLSPDGTQVQEDVGVVVNGDKLHGYSTLEGPKLYKRNGWYYIFAPAGGVKTGWQSVFRSRSIRGPYEDRIVLAQGTTPINGPHQGALVDTPSGEWWFLHFQDRDAYGRIVHLQPVAWADDWPVIGVDRDRDGRGEPVLTHPKPNLPPSPPVEPPSSDEFDRPQLGLQWQWQANPRDDWASLVERPGFLRLFAQPAGEGDLFQTPHLLLQKFPAPVFSVTARLDRTTATAADMTGLIVFGYDYAWLGLRGGSVVFRSMTAADEARRFSERVGPSVNGPLLLRVDVNDEAICRFSFSTDGVRFNPLGEPFQARISRWVGAKFGLFAVGQQGGAADFDWIHVAPGTP